ncbi:hypothetical protein BDR26DRAFT_109813 [Obelidium mucronatum]|nr:hypothetical protein BDR26DRAFT_109813 [Obelidium mucronatum]
MTARNVFIQSKLPDDVLARVWLVSLCMRTDEVLTLWYRDVSSVLKNPSLTFPEFALAMFLIKHKITTGSDIPLDLPPAVRAAVLAATSPSNSLTAPMSGISRSSSGIALSSSVGTMSSFSGGGSMSGYPNRPPAQLPQQRGPAPPIPPQQSGLLPSSYNTTNFGGAGSRGSLTGLNQVDISGSGNTATTWAVTPQEKAGYDATFKTWDPNGSGYISGDRARQIFVQSGLSSEILGHIWTLADTQNSGKLDSNEFAVAMHLIHAKRAGKDLPKTLPANLIPPSTRELDSITSMMKSQVMNDMMTKKPAARNVSGFMPDDPLAAGFSRSGSRSSLSQRVATKEEREEERKIRAAELELKKKELAIVNNRVEAATTAFKDMTKDIDRAKREAINAHDDLVYSLDSRESLIDQVRAMVPDSTRGSGNASGSVSVAETQVNQLEREIQALLSECREMENASAEKQIKTLKAQDVIRGGTGIIAAPTAESTASRANALLAARMAAMGINSPALNVSQSPSGSNNSTLAADVKRVEDAKIASERELEDAAIRVRGLVSSFRTIAQKSAVSDGAAPSGAKGFSASAVLSSLRSWEPPIEQKIKFEEGVGLRSEEVRKVVLDMKNKSKSKGSFAASPPLASKTSVFGNSTPANKPSSVNDYFNSNSRESHAAPLEERRKSNNPFGEFSAPTPQANPSPAPVPAPPVPQTPKPVFEFQNTPFSAGEPNSFARASISAAPARPSVAAQTTSAVNDVVAQAQAAIRAAKERAAARTTNPAGALATPPPIPPSPVLHKAPVAPPSPTKPTFTQNLPLEPTSPTAATVNPFSVAPSSQGNPFGAITSPLLPAAKQAPPPPPSRSAPPPPPPARSTPQQPSATSVLPPAPSTAVTQAPSSGVSDITSQAEDLMRAAKAARGAFGNPPSKPDEPVSSKEPSLDVPPTTERTVSVKDFKNFNPFGGGFSKSAAEAAVPAVSNANGPAVVTASSGVEDTPRVNVKDFKNFNPFGGGFGKSAAEIAEATTAVAPPVPTDVPVVVPGGPPPPPPPPPPMLPSIAAELASAPLGVGSPPLPPPPPPATPAIVATKRSPSPQPLSRQGTNSPTPGAGSIAGHTSLLKSALMKVRVAHSSDDEDGEDDNENDDDEEWGTAPTSKSVSVVVPPTPKPPVPVVSPPQPYIPIVSSPTQIPSLAAVPAPPAPVAFNPPPPPPPPAVGSFDQNGPPMGGAPPPPPPPPPPGVGIAPPVKKFERGTPVEESSAPTRKPDPKDIGGVGVGGGGVNLFAEAAAKAKARAEKAAAAATVTDSHTTAGGSIFDPVPAPPSKQVVTPVFDFFAKPAVETPVAAIPAPVVQRSKPPPPPSKAQPTPAAQSVRSDDDWDLLSKSDTSPVDAAPVVISKSLLDETSGPSRVSLSSNPFGVFSSAAPPVSAPKANDDWMSDFSTQKPVENDDIFAPASQNGQNSFAAAFNFPTPVLYQSRILFDFTPGRPDDLELTANEVVNVEKEDGDWLFGSPVSDASKKGWFPKNYSEVYDPNKREEEEVTPVPPTIVKANDPIGVAEALFDYSARRDDELSVSAGQFLTIFDKSGGDWWDVMNESGDRGLVPATYLKEEGGGSATTSTPGPMPIEREYSLRVSLNSSMDNDAFLSSAPPMMRNSASQQAVSSEGFQHWASVVDQNLLAQLSLQDRKRQEAIFELIQTECHYLRDLQLLVEVFYQPMSQYLSDADLRTIFANIENVNETRDAGHWIYHLSFSSPCKELLGILSC